MMPRVPVMRTVNRAVSLVGDAVVLKGWDFSPAVGVASRCTILSPASRGFIARGTDEGPVLCRNYPQIRQGFSDRIYPFLLNKFASY